MDAATSVQRQYADYLARIIFSMATMYLFRIKVERLPLHTLFPDENNRTSSDFIREAIQLKPEGEIRKNQTWHVGNVEEEINDYLIFAFGKVIKNNTDKFDKQKKDFISEENEDAPNTCIVIDLINQVCAIAANTRISQNIRGISGNLEKLLNSTISAKNNGLTFNVDPLSSPEEFIQIIRSAKRVSSFSMSFGLPNPIDVDKDFHKPMEMLLQESKASEGTTKITGDDIDRNTIAELARSAASTGNSASARVHEEGKSKGETKRMSGNQMSISTDDTIDRTNINGVIGKIRDIYRNIRGTDGQS